MAAQSVKHPELRSLKEVQLSIVEFDSRLRHGSWGENPSHTLWGSVRQNICTQIKCRDWARRKKMSARHLKGFLTKSELIEPVLSLAA